MLLDQVGLVRMGTFYDQVHPPTLGMTLGTCFILLASITCFSVVQSRPVLHEGALIAVFVTVTTPITLMLLARAALYPDRNEGAEEIPADFEDAGKSDVFD